MAIIILLIKADYSLAQADKSTLATKAMKAVVDQVESDWIDDRWSKVQLGPFLSSTINTRNGRIHKGIAIKIG